MAQANIRAVITAEDRASKTLQGFGANAASLNDKIASTAKVAAVALAAAATAAVAFGVKSASELQQSRVAFETMLGSADKARKMMQRLSDFAIKTPFDLPQVVEGAKSLLAYGISADKILPTFKSLGSIAAAVGKDKLPQLTLAFGQVRAAGKLTGAELRQFTEAGVPLLEILAKQSGKTAAEVKEAMENGAAPSFKEVEKAIFSMSEKGGKFYNLLEKQSKTLAGTFSNLKDVAIRSLSEIVGVSVTGEVRKGSIFYFLEIGAKSLLDFLSRNQKPIVAFIDGIFNAFKNMISWFASNILPVLSAIWQSFLKGWNAAMVYLKPAIDSLIKVFKEELLPTLEIFWSKHGREVTESLLILAAVIGAAVVGAIILFAKTLSALIWAISRTVSGLSKLYEWNKKLWSPVMKLAGAFFQLGVKFGSFIRVALSQSTSFVSKLSSIFSRAFQAIARPFAAAFQFVIDGISRIRGALSNLGSLPKKAVKALGLRSGGMVRARSGVVTRVGEEGAENVILPSGSRVMRNIDSKMGGGSTINNFNFNVGYFMGTAVERRKAAEQIWKDVTDLAARHGKSPAELMGM